MAKWDALRKKDRDEQIVNYASLHPNKSMKEIGEDFKISESRVSRILKKARESGKKV